MAKHRLYAIRVFSFSWEESLAFYRDVLDFPLMYVDANIGWAQFELGPAYLGLERCDPSDKEAQALVGRFVGVSIEVSELQTRHEQLVAKGVEFTSEPTKQSWGGTLAHLKDPDGNIITLLDGDP